MQNAFFPIQHLDRPPIEVGGLCYFYFVPWADVLQWPEINPISGTITDDIILKEGKSWLRCQAIEKGRAYSENQKDSDAGNYVEMSVTGFLRDDSPVNAYSVNLMKHRRFAVVLKERNGIMRLLGNRYSGVAFSQNYTSADADGTRGRNLTFSWQSPDAAPLYLTAVSADGDIINPPWVPPVNPGGGGSGTGRMVYNPLYFLPVEGQTNFSDPDLVDKEILMVAVPPETYSPTGLETGYSFVPSSGTIMFHSPLHASENVIVLYADANSGANGRTVYDPIFFDPHEGQTIYTNPALLNVDILMLTAPPVVFNPKGDHPDYIFSPTTATITFTHPLHDFQRVIILYANQL